MTASEVLKQARQSFVDHRSARPADCQTRKRSIVEEVRKASLGDRELESAIWSALCEALASCFEPIPLICCDGVDAQGFFVDASPTVILQVVDQAMTQL
jgi:hypothetical protein